MKRVRASLRDVRTRGRLGRIARPKAAGWPAAPWAAEADDTGNAAVPTTATTSGRTNEVFLGNGIRLSFCGWIN